MTPASKARNISLCRKNLPLSKKKTLIDLLGLACKKGYLLFVPKKKKLENELIEGPLLRKA